MRVLVTSIPFSGMKIDAPISMDALNARLREGSVDNALVFLDAPMADLTLTRTHGGVIVKGIVSGTCKQDCSSCGDLVAHEALASIDWILQSASDRAAPDDEMDDPGVIFYDGEHVDLEEPLQEALILSLSPFWHPPRDPAERCLECKRDCSARAWSSADSRSENTKESSKPNSRPAFAELLTGALKGKKGA
jgi:uncharacterized metal-binding protein YceD (DUF177 family)